MSKPLMSLCSVPVVADKDGHAGASAKFLLPFYGYWMASGQVLSFPDGTIHQDRGMRMGGASQPDTFQKDCCTCSQGGDNLRVEDLRPL